MTESNANTQTMETALPPLDRRSSLRLLGLGMMGLSGLASGAIAGAATLSSGVGRDGGDWHDLHLGADRYLIVPVKINGVECRAIIDSGATRSVIQHDLALDLNLPYSGAGQVQTFTRPIEGSFYRVDDLRIDGFHLANTYALSQELAEIENITNQNTPFLIGQDLLRQVDLQVDFPSQKARFFDRHSRPAGARYTKIPFHGLQAESLPALNVLFEGRNYGAAILDLGNDIPISMSAEFARQCNLLENRPQSTAMSVGVEGTSLDKVFCLRDARLGPYILNQIPTTVIEDWELATPIALGWPFLRAFDAVFSFHEGTMWLDSNPQLLSAPFPKDRSGIGARRSIDHITVVHVARDSPAWNAGLRPDDRIVAIDGRQIDGTYPSRDIRLGWQAAGTRIAFRLADERTMQIVLNDYY